ncbi:MAG: hypothetical protein Q9214_006998, partial [Letrouitia sp. 1 TL-2023]
TLVSPLSRIPNAHWSSSVSPGWILWIRKDGLENRVLLECHRKLGPIVRTSPNEISICRIEDVRTVYSGNFEKEAWLARSFDNYGVKNMFSMENMKSHAERKRMIWQAYSRTQVLASGAMKDICDTLVVKRLLPQLKQAVTDRKSCNVVDLSCSWVMDFITAYLFSIENGSNLLVQSSLRGDFFENYRIRSFYAFWPAQFPNLVRYLNKASFGLTYRVAKSANDRIEAWCMNMCNASEASYRRSFCSRKQPGNVYSHLRVQLEQATQKLDANEPSATSAVPSSLHTAIASEMLDHCAAPQETAGTVLSFCMHQLSLKPSIQKSLRKELCSALPELNRDSLDPKDLETLDYLQAVILETLRLHNHTPGPPRITPDNGCTLAGFSIPSGTRVSALAYVLHRNETIFTDAELFRPERWTDVDELEKVRMQRHIWAFGSGDRQCIALHFATTGMASSWWFIVE